MQVVESIIQRVCLSFLGQVPSFTQGCNLWIGSLDAFKAVPVNQGALEFLAGSLARGFGMLASRSWHDMPTMIQNARIHT